MKIISTLLVLLTFSIFSIGQITPVNLTFDEVRELSEINEYGIAEAYPWISDDGLTLYYNTQDNDGKTVIYKADRDTPDDEFSNFQQISVNFANHDNISPILSPDELEIYFVKRNPSEIGVYLFKASRNSISEPFNTINEIEIIGLDDLDGKIYFMARVCLTPDKSQMFAYHTYQTTEILILDKTNENQYTVSDTLNIPEGYISSPGSLSNDGLKYYIGLTNETTSEKYLYYFHRESLNEEFQNIYLVQNENIYNLDKTISQPYFSTNQNYFVCAVNSGSWASNDLLLAQNQPTGFSTIQNSSNIYPNPTSDYFSIETNNQILEDSYISIYTINGILVQRNAIKSCNSTINVQNLSTGTYIYKINTTNGTETGKIIKK